MGTETIDKKIMIYNENFKRFALADDGRTIELSGKKHSRIAIAGNKNKVRVFGTPTSQNTAVAGKDVKICVKATAANTAVSGENLATEIANEYSQTAVVGREGLVDIRGVCCRTAVICVKATAANTAVSGENLAAEIANEYSQTAVVGREGNVDIRGVCCRTAVGVYEAEINITSDYNSTAICACAAINVTGNHNKIAVVGCSPTISCTGTDNNIISFGPYTTFSGTAGNCITVADYNYERRVTGFVTGWIGENGLKENVRYRVRKGQFVEVTS